MQKIRQLQLIHVRSFGCSATNRMPYAPEERPPMTDSQKKLYPQVQQEFTDEGYPILKVHSNRNAFEVRRSDRLRGTRKSFTPRERRMSENQDWPSVWPTAKTFSPSAVPLPLRQSYEEKANKVPRGKYANMELMKIPNFLHLSPAAIERHCRALKKFCTEWPKELENHEKVREYLPITYVTKDYIHSAPTIRDPRARVVQLKVNVKSLKLNSLDEDKLIQLAAHRYNENTQELTLEVSACPTRNQNKDYADYLLTALYSESRNHQEWEKDKPVQQERHDDLDTYRANIEQKLGFKPFKTIADG